jgi:hypothetical protein
MAELAAPTKLLFTFIYIKKGRAGCRKTTAIQFILKKWQSWLRQQNCYTICVFGTLFPTFLEGF